MNNRGMTRLELLILVVLFATFAVLGGSLYWVHTKRFELFEPVAQVEAANPRSVAVSAPPANDPSSRPDPLPTSMSMTEQATFLQRSETSEALAMASMVKMQVHEYFVTRGVFPADNAVLGLPNPEKMISNRVSAIEVADGAIHVTLGKKVSSPLRGKVLTMRPAMVAGQPQLPLSWVCGNDLPAEGMGAVGENRTDVPAPMLPRMCRRQN